jgi:hypothetical protein
MVGGDSDLDACGVNAEVVLAHPGQGRLNVREGPGLGHSVKEQIDDGQVVIVCDQTAGGAWLGIVYSREDFPCGLGSPIPIRQAYVGPCASGWAASRYIGY